MIKCKGFTLIELLVVIAIIGLLSSMGIVSLNGAREKAYDAQIKSDLSQIRTWAMLNFEPGNYGDFDTFDVEPRLIPPACTTAEGSGNDRHYKYNADDDFWVAWATLCSSNDTMDFCVDHTGRAIIISNNQVDPLGEDCSEIIAR